jgi:hypothetical protein
MIRAYLDESGNLGIDGRYFVISAVVCPDEKSAYRVKRIMKKACLDFAEEGADPLEEIKSYELGFEQKQGLLTKLASKADHDVFLLIADKHNIDLFKRNIPLNVIYNYLCGVLAKRIIRKYNEDICFTFDQRSTKVKSMNALSDYIQTKAYTEWNFKHNLEILQRDSKSVYCLQAADLMANVAYCSYRDNRTHLLDISASRIEDKVHYPFATFGN